MRTSVLLLFLLMIPASYALEGFNFVLDEEGKVITYYYQYYVVQVHGYATVTNANNYSLFNIIMPFDLSTLTIVETTDTEYVKPDRIYIPLLTAGQQVTFEYDIFGIIPYNFTLPGKGFLETALEGSDKTADSILSMTILKAPIENESYTDGMANSVAGRRLVSLIIENPTDFTHNVSYIKVIKTAEQDPNTELNSWTFPEDGEEQITIIAHDSWRREIVDYNSSDGEVYWLSSRIILDFLTFFNYSHDIRWYTQDELLNPANNSMYEEEDLSNITSYLEHFLYFKKSISSSVLMPGDEVRVSFSIHNFAPIQRNITLADSLPAGFSLLNSSEATVVQNNVSWQKEVSKDSALTLSYLARFIDNESVGLDYFEPAVLKYENKTLYSQRLPFVRQYLPAKKVFVQKKLSYSINDEISVNLKVQNLGESEITELYVMEHLSERDVFREMTALPESRGVWKIPVLKEGATWDVTYITDENEAVNLLPEIFGVENQVVLKTLVFENVVKNEWVVKTMQLAEIVGIAFLVLFPIAAFVYFRRRRMAKERTLRELGEDVHRLRDATTPPGDVQIDVMKRESGSSSVPEVDQALKAPPMPKRRGLRAMAHENLEEMKKLESKR